MKKNAILILMILISFFSFTVEAQTTEEEVFDTEKGVGEDELIVDEEAKKRKQLKKPPTLGLPLHDQYTDAVWDYLQKTKELTDLANFITVELIETDDPESEITTEIIIRNGLGKDVTWDNALLQLKAIEKNLEEQQKQSQSLDVLLNKSSNEKVPFKQKVKSLKVSAANTKIQGLAVVELGKTLFNVGKNIATLLKIENLNRKQ